MMKPDEPCKHAFPTPAQCPICSKEPETKRDNVVVYISEGGEAYHFDPNCAALLFGQQLVRDRGGEEAPIVPAYERNMKFERKPCNTCRGKRPK